MDRNASSPSDEFEVVTPAEVQLAGEDSRPVCDGRGRQRLLPWLSLAGLALLGVALLAVVSSDALRPDTASIAMAPEPEPAQEAAAGGADETKDATGSGAEGGGEASEEPPSPYRDSIFERQREAVQDTISELVELQEQLEEKAVERWGAEALAEAEALADEGDDAFQEEAFETARSHYDEALEVLRELLERSEQVYSEALDRGQRALSEGDAAMAHEAFDLASAIEPDSQAAARGLARAETLDDVLALVRQADERAERDELDAAEAKLQEALEIDDQAEQARQRLAELEGRIRERDFNDALSHGYAALAEGELDAARVAFATALTLHRDADEAEEGLRMVDQATTDRRIERLREEALALEEEERWEEAVERYEQVLELDPTVSFARRGKERAQEHDELSRRIERTLEDPDALSDDAALARAEELLSRARQIEEPPPGLAEQIEALDELLSVAGTPVTVELRSDGATEVTIIGVAPLGSFEEHSLKLRPGVYTAKGTREGFRDVRKEFRVQPDSNSPVEVEVEERI